MLTSMPSTEAAEGLAGVLIDERMAACVQLLPAVLSIYRWQGQRVRESECLMLIKTRTSLAARCQQRIAALHPYECPEIVSLHPDGVNSSYARWLLENTQPVPAFA